MSLLHAAGTPARASASKDPVNAAASRCKEEQGPMEKQKTVLVIDDIMPFRELLSHILEASGYAVRAYRDGPSALHATDEPDFHAVITDYSMPHMTGAEVARHLRKRFPASLIVGTSLDNKREEFLAAGANAFLLKPFGSDDLLRLLDGTADS